MKTKAVRQDSLAVECWLIALAKQKSVTAASCLHANL
jgi:hypothetical protein